MIPDFHFSCKNLHFSSDLGAVHRQWKRENDPRGCLERENPKTSIVAQENACLKSLDSSCSYLVSFAFMSRVSRAFPLVGKVEYEVLLGRACMLLSYANNSLPALKAVCSVGGSSEFHALYIMVFEKKATPSNTRHTTDMTFRQDDDFFKAIKEISEYVRPFGDEVTSFPPMDCAKCSIDKGEILPVPILFKASAITTQRWDCWMKKILANESI
ncbi:hypothetical protein L484_008974 [Morus notabilis]|uniref:Uncharacterized protein n=1 Tax=Morus notabilis TaxID=981085 RepID=W9SIU4_9ROSA|nr:hypothetical protein L484_008974 [Morus notabilis]